MVKNAFESVVPRGPNTGTAVPKTYHRGKSPAPNAPAHQTARRRVS